MNALLVGWFSWEHSDSTAGDFLVCDVVRDWLTSRGHRCDVALAPPFDGGVDLLAVDPSDYGRIVFVCGPFMQNHWEAEFFRRFADSCIVGINLTLPIPLEQWNPFDLLIERDSSRGANPDLAFASAEPAVPVIGVCRVEPYPGALVHIADAAIDRLLTTREMAIVPIDTRLDVNTAGLRTKAEVESLIAKMDAVITTRLHGTVLALKNGVPALAIDAEPAVGKIMRQVETIQWPVVFRADALNDADLQAALTYCLSAAAREQALLCSARAIAMAGQIERRFTDAIEVLPARSDKRDQRLAFASRPEWVGRSRP